MPPEDLIEDDTQIEEDDDDGDFGDEMGIDFGAMLEPFLATDDGQTVCTALVTIAKHMEMQNKILVKILTQLSKKA